MRVGVFRIFFAIHHQFPQRKLLLAFIQLPRLIIHLSLNIRLICEFFFIRPHAKRVALKTLLRTRIRVNHTIERRLLHRRQYLACNPLLYIGYFVKRLVGTHRCRPVGLALIMHANIQRLVIVLRNLARGKTHDIKKHIHRSQLFRQVNMTTNTSSATNNLFRAHGVPVWFCDMNIANITQVDTFCARRGNHENFNDLAIHIIRCASIQLFGNRFRHILPLAIEDIADDFLLFRGFCAGIKCETRTLLFFRRHVNRPVAERRLFYFELREPVGF